MQNINFVGSRKSSSQGYMFCLDFFFFLIMQKAAFQETGFSMKSTTTGRWCYNTGLTVYNQSPGSCTNTLEACHILNLVSTVAFTLRQYCTAFKSHNVQDLKTVMTATRTVPTQDCLKKKVLIKEATNILQVVTLHHLIRVISNVPLHTFASNIWLMLWLWTIKLRGKRNTSLAQVRGS